jgi:hypothetical protein
MDETNSADTKDAVACEDCTEELPLDGAFGWAVSKVTNRPVFYCPKCYKVSETTYLSEFIEEAAVR